MSMAESGPPRWPPCAPAIERTMCTRAWRASSSSSATVEPAPGEPVFTCCLLGAGPGHAEDDFLLGGMDVAFGGRTGWEDRVTDGEIAGPGALRAYVEKPLASG